jgi:hypothetical protein
MGKVLRAMLSEVSASTTLAPPLPTPTSTPSTIPIDKPEFEIPAFTLTSDLPALTSFLSSLTSPTTAPCIPLNPRRRKRLPVRLFPSEILDASNSNISTSTERSTSKLYNNDGSISWSTGSISSHDTKATLPTYNVLVVDDNSVCLVVR